MRSEEMSVGKVTFQPRETIRDQHFGPFAFFSQRVDTLWMLCVLAASFSVIYFWPTSADLLLTFLVPPISFLLTNQMIYSRTK